MEDVVYDTIFRIEKDHFWSRSRRVIVGKVLRKFLKKPSGNTILDVGCGVGADYELLTQFGAVDFVDMEERALRYFRSEHPTASVFLGNFPDCVPRDKRYNVITMLDVLEHIEEDVRALEACVSLLDPKDGRILLTVPACPSLYGHTDKANRHFRRYTRASLKRVIQTAGYSTSFLSYYNTFLFPIEALFRLRENRKTRYSLEEEYAVPNTVINSLCRLIFSAERHFLPTFSFPFGMSLMAVITPNKKCSRG